MRATDRRQQAIIILILALVGSACSGDPVFVSSIDDKDASVADLDAPELVQLCDEATTFLLDNGAAQSAARIACTVNGQSAQSSATDDYACERAYAQCMIQASVVIAGISPNEICAEVQGADCQIKVEAFEACVGPLNTELESVADDLTCDSDPASVLNAFVTVENNLGNCQELFEDCGEVFGDIIETIGDNLSP
ncbi:MAG: hypothetical protein VX210_01790 [Myxococcota bacterium]|nr:hypothetical protein [Myxococcota bacterium]